MRRRKATTVKKTPAFIICGSREFTDWVPVDIIVRGMVSYDERRGDGNIVLVHGAANGADTLAARAGERIVGNDRVRAYPADWDAFGRKAGPLRNEQMLKEEPTVDIVWAFLNGDNTTTGTKDMINRSIALGKTVYVVRRYGPMLEQGMEPF